MSASLKFYIDGILNSFKLENLLRRSDAEFNIIDKNGDVYWNRIYESTDDADPVNTLWIKQVSITEMHLKRGSNVICKFNPSDDSQIIDIDYNALKDAIITSLGLGTASVKDVGVLPGQVLELDAAGLLPPVDGSQLLNVKDGTPVGAIMYWPTVAPPENYIIADGSAISRETYQELFDVIGTTYGEGDGTTTFQTPDLRGVFVRGIDAGRGIDTGRVFGSLQEDELKNHFHTVANTVVGIQTGDQNGGIGARFISTGVTNSSSTGGTETRPKNIALLGCIKYK